MLALNDDSRDVGYKLEEDIEAKKLQNNLDFSDQIVFKSPGSHRRII